MDTTKIFKKFLTDNKSDNPQLLQQLFQLQNNIKLCREDIDLFNHYYTTITPRKNAKIITSELLQELTKVVE